MTDSAFATDFCTIGGGDKQIVTFIRIGDKMTATQCSYRRPGETVPENERTEFAIIFRPLLEPGSRENADQYDPEQSGCCIAFKDVDALNVIINQLIDVRDNRTYENDQS